MLGYFYTADVMLRECRGTKWMELTQNGLITLPRPLIFANSRIYECTTVAVVKGLERNALFLLRHDIVYVFLGLMPSDS